MLIRDLSTAANRKFWSSAERCSRIVDSWPAWKRAGAAIPVAPRDRAEAGGEEAMNTCSCSCDSHDIGECSGHTWSQLVKAKKPHRCVECRVVIQPGEQYHSRRSVVDGTWYRDASCVLCERIMLDLGVCCQVGKLWSTIEYCYEIEPEYLR